ncbi:S1 RNA-binding domain-containing protein [Oenococcus sicerae]|uniref:S1 RNA-binding domain-containing protein n=1 Tax=Oenococcus sicerae TaxID=2203724 RepID=A0AAJ1VR01_9LACO|nr:CvfD/Ygs/GSP13 family RNA-binding post-transcriptional regulator [Oenococcus sicerae]MDN6900817.1 S1 RNA-binding domain-containing protein [Oenococcus sicerae]QAS69096.1 S1 RNA-binding domain-containing protein [Oenococcus sicerae]
MDYKIGQHVNGIISGIQDYGVFVQLDAKTQGLVHISECKAGRINNLTDDFRVGQDVDAIVLDIDDYSKKISLSFRQLSISKIHANPQPGENRNIYKHFWTATRVKAGFKPIAETIEASKTEALKRIRQVKK